MSGFGLCFYWIFICRMGISLKSQVSYTTHLSHLCKIHMRHVGGFTIFLLLIGFVSRRPGVRIDIKVKTLSLHLDPRGVSSVLDLSLACSLSSFVSQKSLCTLPRCIAVRHRQRQACLIVLYYIYAQFPTPDSVAQWLALGSGSPDRSLPTRHTCVMARNSASPSSARRREAGRR